VGIIQAVIAARIKLTMNMAAMMPIMMRGILLL
jgi:hypothetical protein